MIILVTGKSGTGKSTFARELASKLKYQYVDIDAIGHKIYESSKVLQKVATLFGKVIFDENGSFDRKRLGQIVFAEKNSARVKKFNRYTLQVMQTEIDKILSKNNHVVLDWIKLPLTKYWKRLSYKVLVISSNDEARFDNLLKRDNVKIEYLKLREKSSIEYDESEFNFIINNDYDNANAAQVLDKLTADINNVIYFKALGTKSPFAHAKNACPSYFLKSGDSKFLLDAGSGSHRFFDMKEVESLNIFISHLHRDHYNDLYNYMYSAYSLKNLGLIKEKFNIYLPSSPSAIVEDIKNEKLTYSNVETFEECSQYQFKGVTIDFLKVEHDKYIDCYAIRVKNARKSVVYTGDISYSNRERLISFAKNCNALICEASLLRKHNFPVINSHLTAQQAASIAKDANVKKLLLTHFWADEKLSNYLKEAKLIFKNTNVLQENDEFYI